jgi:hypothetical protein
MNPTNTSLPLIRATAAQFAEAERLGKLRKEQHDLYGRAPGMDRGSQNEDCDIQGVLGEILPWYALKALRKDPVRGDPKGWTDFSPEGKVDGPDFYLSAPGCPPCRYSVKTSSPNKHFLCYSDRQLSDPAKDFDYMLGLAFFAPDRAIVYAPIPRDVILSWDRRRGENGSYYRSYPLYKLQRLYRWTDLPTTPPLISPPAIVSASASLASAR